MARREILVSDISGEVLPLGEGHTVTFTYQNKSYALDVTSKELQAFEAALAPYITAGRSVSSSAKSKSGGSSRSSQELAAIRGWLKENDHAVSDRGRIAQNLIDLYDAAH